MRLYVIRHGETEWNKTHLIQGVKGVDLNENGVLLAELTRDAMKDIPFDLCLTSPLIRARHTAEIIMEGHDAPIFDEIRLMEINFGIYEGTHPVGENADWYHTFHFDPWNCINPKGETMMQVCERTKDLFDELAADECLKDKTILISTHGCAGRAFMRSVYEDKEDFWHGGAPRNCAVSIVDVIDGKVTLVESDHLYYDPELSIPTSSIVSGK